MEPLNEGRPRLKGIELRNRLEQLRETAATEHHRFRDAWRGALQHARAAGVALVEVKWRLGHRTRWGRWKRRLAKEHAISTRVMSQYMQVARHWDDPRITAVRDEGIEIESIQGFLNVLRGKHPHGPHGTDEGATQLRRRIGRMIANYTGGLDVVELRMLETMMEDQMEQLHYELRRAVRYTEGDYYGDQKTTMRATRERRRVRRARQPREDRRTEDKRKEHPE